MKPTLQVSLKALAAAVTVGNSQGTAPQGVAVPKTDKAGPSLRFDVADMLVGVESGTVGNTSI
jgi:hypothetical protein